MHNPPLNHAPFGRRTLCDKPAHHRLALLQGFPYNYKQLLSWVDRRLHSGVDILMQRVRTVAIQTVIGAASVGSGP